MHNKQRTRKYVIILLLIILSYVRLYRVLIDPTDDPFVTLAANGDFEGCCRVRKRDGAPFRFITRDYQRIDIR